jgi:hypothetical protein
VKKYYYISKFRLWEQNYCRHKCRLSDFHVEATDRICCTWKCLGAQSKCSSKLMNWLYKIHSSETLCTRSWYYLPYANPSVPFCYVRLLLPSVGFSNQTLDVLILTGFISHSNQQRTHLCYPCHTDGMQSICHLAFRHYGSSLALWWQNSNASNREYKRLSSDITVSYFHPPVIFTF